MCTTTLESCHPSTDDERRREIASLFAAAILRLRSRAALPFVPAGTRSPENLPNSAVNSLELSQQNRLSVHSG
jgi:hypothetical protein